MGNPTDAVMNAYDVTSNGCTVSQSRKLKNEEDQLEYSLSYAYLHIQIAEASPSSLDDLVQYIIIMQHHAVCELL